MLLLLLLLLSIKFPPSWMKSLNYIWSNIVKMKTPINLRNDFSFLFHGFSPNSAPVMQSFILICHCHPTQSKIRVISNPKIKILILGRFDEDGSWIGQYGTLRRKHQQRVSAESGLPPGATYVWWSSPWSSSGSWWWSCRPSPWWWTRWPRGKTLERTYLGRIKSRSSLLPSAIYVWISTQSENRNLSPQSEEKAGNLVDKAKPWSFLRV